MLGNWSLTYDRSTSEMSQCGLQSSFEGLFSSNGDVEFLFNSGITIKRKRFTYTPVFVFISADKVVVASHYLLLLSMLKSLGVPLEVNLSYAIDYLSYQCPWTCSTFCEQIQIVRNAEELTVPKAGAITRKFNSLYRDQTPEPDIAYFLSDELNRLDFSKTAFHISSGLDSSLLVLLAAKLQSPCEITAVTCVTRGRGTSNEIEIIKKLKTDTGFRLKIFDFTDADVFANGKELISECIGYPCAHPSHLVEYLIDKEASKKFSFIISGRGPDECLAGYSWHLSEYGNIEKYISRMRVTNERTIHSIFKKHDLFSQDKFKSHLYDCYGDHLSIHDRLEIDQRMLAESWSIVHSGIEYGLQTNIIKPFQNRELSDALFNLDDALMIRDGVQKNYMRDTMSSLYKDYLLSAPKQGFRLDLKPYMLDTRFVDEILGSEFAYRHLNESEIMKIYYETTAGRENYGWQLWSLYLLVHSSTLIY